MQAEHSRGNGFIVSPLSAPVTVENHKKNIKNISRKKGKANLENALKDMVNEAIAKRTFVFKKVLSTSLSVGISVCSLMIWSNFFTIGTAVYHNNKLVAFSSSEKAYQNELAAAKKYAESNNEENINFNFTCVPTLALRSKISTKSSLRNKLLISTDSFATACTLYSGDTPLFSAQNEAIAKKVVDEYISIYAMNGEAETELPLTYKTSVIPKSRISDEEKCLSLLDESDKVPVISVVTTSEQKEIPFETLTQNDSDLFVGETVTVTEGKIGSSEIESETIYRNGTPQSSRILSENIITTPVTQVVRVGTKPKDVLQKGMYYPLTGTLSSPFGARWGRMHEGIDIAVPIGTPVKAAESGTVSYAGNAGSYGNLVRIDHGNGVVTAYAHLDRINVSVGQTVTRDTEIAFSGNTGRSTGPHLHFEVVKNGTPLNPDKYLKKR